MKEVLSIEWMTRDQNERISGAIEQERRRNSNRDCRRRGQHQHSEPGIHRHVGLRPSRYSLRHSPLTNRIPLLEQDRSCPNYEMRFVPEAGLMRVSWDFGDVPLPLGEGGAKRRVRAGIAPSSGPSGHLLPEGEGHARRGGHFREDHSVHAKFHTDLQILEFRISNFQCSRPPTRDL